VHFEEVWNKCLRLGMALSKAVRKVPQAQRYLSESRRTLELRFAATCHQDDNIILYWRYRQKNEAEMAAYPTSAQIRLNEIKEVCRSMVGVSAWNPEAA